MLRRNFKRSFVRKVLEYDEEAAGKDDHGLDMDFEFAAGWFENWGFSRSLIGFVPGFDDQEWNRTVWGL